MRHRTHTEFSRALRALAAPVVRLLLVATVLAAPYSLPAPQAAALTSTTIAIDGNFDDWIGVRSDPDNVAFDTQVPDDPDWPGQPDRDLFYVNSTYDDEYLYFCWRRTAGGNKSITLGAYLDLGGDGLLNEGEDVVVAWTMTDPTSPAPSQQNYDEQGRILQYYQARDSDGDLVHPIGDPMDHYGPPPTAMQNPPPVGWQTYAHTEPHGDGNTPDGWAIGLPSWGENIPSKQMDGYMDPVSGIEAEAKVAWSDLGFSAGEIPPRIAIHFASGNGEDFGTANKTSLWSENYRVVSGKLQESNRGQVEDNVRGLYWLSTSGVAVSPDHVSGALAGTTVVYEHTVTNTSNATDTFDLSAASSLGWTTEIVDETGGTIDSVVLGPNASATVFVRVVIPAGAADGQSDVTEVRATSRADHETTEFATDTTRVGPLTVTPDQSSTMAPGHAVEYQFTVQNNTAASGTFDLNTSSTLSFPGAIVDAGGSPISSVSLGSGESTTVVVQVSVPGTATVGMQDVTVLEAQQQGETDVRSSARAQTTVAEGLAVQGIGESYGGAGSWAQYTHTVVNSWPVARTIDLSAVSSAGWPVHIFASDGVTEITQLEIGPNGAAESIVVRVQIPSDAGSGAEDFTTITGSIGGLSRSATDHTIVRLLATYMDPGYMNEHRDYYLTDQVYARATGLPPSSDVYFVWKDVDGRIVRTSTVRQVDTQGMAFDEYLTRIADPIGAWTVEVYDAKKDTLLEVVPFFVNYKGEITELSATDAPNVGDDVAITSSTENLIGKDIDDSFMEYLIWWDNDGDGSFGPGDIYIDASGAPHTWDGLSSVTPTHVTTGIDVPGKSIWSEPSPWTVNNAQFPNQGTYNVTATWYDSAGAVIIDEKTTQFYSVPALGWPLFALVFVGGATWMWRRRGSFAIGGAAA